MKRFAVLLGTEKYTEFRKTDFCHSDVDTLYSVLTEKCDYAIQDVLAMKLAPGMSEASPSEILKQIDVLISNSTEGDSVLFFYAGHGDSHDGESYLILPDTRAKDKAKTALPLRDITRSMSKNGRLNIRIFDTCHSGQDITRAVEKIDSSGFTRAILEERNEGAITFASCKADEFSYSDPDLGNGVFTHYLSEAISGFKDEEPVLPELVKVALCDKVKMHSNKTGRPQTPTYTSFIQGNIAIAVRKVPVVEDARNNLESVQERSIEHLEERLNSIRSIPLVGGDKHIEILKTGIESFYDRAIAAAPTHVFFDKTFSFEEPINCDNMPYFLKRHIIPLFEKERALHNFSIEYEYKETTNNLFTQMNPQMSPLFSKKVKVPKGYYINQTDPFPLSFVLGTIESDGYFPSCGMFVYLVPLQISVAVVSGTYIDNSFKSARGYGNDDGKNTHVYGLSRKIYTIEQIKTDSWMDAIDAIWTTFQEALGKVMEERLSYLEWEHNNATVE